VKKVIHDGDAAYEDIMALMLLLLNADVVAVTVTYGESTTHLGAANMERVCRMLRPGLNIPVAFGMNHALDYNGIPFPDFIKIEEDTILEGTSVPEIATSQVMDSAVNLLYTTLMSSEEKITIVATGPLTNIAQLICAHPECVEKIQQLVIMGGAIHVPGNISDLIPDTKNTVAEWNIYADPKAAQIVFNTPKLSILLVPIDITRQMPMTRAFYSALEKETASSLKLVRDMLTSLLKGMGETLFYGKLQFWDSLSAMIALDPSMATLEALPLTVDLLTGQVLIHDSAIAGVTPVKVATQLEDVSSAYNRFIRLMNNTPNLAVPDLQTNPLLRTHRFISERSFFPPYTKENNTGIEHGYH